MSFGTVTAVFVTFNSAAVIGDALQSLPRGCKAIMVDNASTDDSAACASSLGAKVIHRTDNAGFGIGCNDGMLSASTPYVLLLNPDARLRPGALEALLAAAESHPEAWMLVPTIYREDGSRFAKWQSAICEAAFKPSVHNDKTTRPISFASGAAILLRREKIIDLGGFDPDLFLFFEDDDLSRRVLDAGGRILHVINAEVDHAGGTSSPQTVVMTEMKHWHMEWSERYVRLKHGVPVWSRWKLLESALKLAISKLSGNQNEQAKQRGAFNGTLAGLKGAKAQNVRAKTDGK